MTSQNTKIMDLVTISNNFPELKRDEINRGNIINTMETIYQNDYEIILLEGNEGIGKTTLSAQFARKYPNNTFSLFIQPTSQYLYDPDFLIFDLCNQISWIVQQKIIHNLEDASINFLRNNIFKLTRIAKANKQKYYFIIDGLDEIPDESNQCKEIILDLLPFGLPNFYFLLTGQLNGRLVPYLEETQKSKLTKTLPLTGFTLDETITYLKDLDLDLSFIEEIHQTSRGIPGTLASIKRILQSGVALKDLELTDEIVNYFEIEWRKVNDEDEKENELLAILAHDRNSCRIEELAELMEIDEDQIIDICINLDFLIIEKGIVSFISESFRKFAEKKLLHLKEETINNQIRRMLEKPTSDHSLRFLPSYLEKAQRYEEILTFTSEDFFKNAIGITQSLCPIKKNIEIAIKAASEITRYGDLLKFSIEKCMINQLDFTDVLSSEIEAQMSLDNYDLAIHLANGCSLKEDRLHMLAIITKNIKQNGPIPESLLDQIKNIYSQIDIKNLGGKSIDIATVLIHSCPNLAIELVEKSICENNETVSLDLAFTKLSLAAIESNRDYKLTEDFLEKISPHIKDPDIKNFFQGASILLGELSATDVIREVNKLENINDMLRLLRLWLISNEKSEDAYQIIEYALELAIKTSDYVPDAKVLREIATPLPYIKDINKSKQLLGYFDSQKLAIKKLGPTEDYIRLELICAKTESKFDQDKVRNRMVEIYYEIDPIVDIGLKALCLSRVLVALDYIDKEMILEEREGFHSLITDELKKCLDELLNVTADHFVVTKNIIESLAKNKFHVALNLIEKMNTEYRRDNGLLLLLETYLKQPLDRIDFELIIDGINKITSPKLQGIAIFKTIQRLYQEKDIDLVKQKLISAQIVLSNFNKIYDSGKKCRALCYLYNIYDKTNYIDLFGDSTLTQLKKSLNDTWESIDAAWVKLDVGFKIVSYIAKLDRVFAQEFMEKIEKFRESLYIKNYTTAFNLFHCNKLAIKAFSGLLDKKLDTTEDINQLTLTINSLPSSGEKAKLWADLALVLYRNGRIEACKEIVNKKIRPLIQEVLETNRSISDEVIIQVSPALYCTHHLTAFELIRELPLEERDYAYAEICDFLLTKLLPGDPKEYNEGQLYDVSYDEILNLCEVLKNIETDFLIYHYIKCISDTINSRRGQHHFTNQQRINITDKLKEIVNAKLPNTRFIKHNGWKIVSLAELGRLHNSLQNWGNLVDSVEDVNNFADKVFILIKLAAALPPKFTEKRKSLIQETIESVENIPIPYEKIGHYELIANTFLSTDTPSSKKCIEAAVKTILTSDDNNDAIIHSQKRLVDLAFKISPDFASHIASLVDDDKARNNIKRNFHNRIKLLEVKQELIEQKTKVESFKDDSLNQYPKAAWIALGSLYSGRCGTCDIDNLVKYSILASKMPLKESYPLILWIIENAVIRFRKTDSAKTVLRPFFEAIIQATFCSLKIANHSIKSNEVSAYIGNNHTSLILQPGERQNALQFISNWLEGNLKEELIIVDQYFGPEELEFIKIINSIKPNCKVTVLTSQKHHNSIKSPLEAYKNQWMKISDVSPPDVDLVLIGIEGSDQSPIHDRWILTEGSGLRLGTSLNSLGLTKISEISQLTPEEADLYRREVEQYITHKKRQYNDLKLNYLVFTL